MKEHVVFTDRNADRPIRVIENKAHFLVEIPAIQKTRASRIAGRRWDPGLVAWVYPKTLDCYEALKAEFSKDAEVFDIRKPKRKPIPRVPDTEQNPEDLEFENEWRKLSEETSNINAGFTSFSEKFDAISMRLSLLEDVNQLILDKMESQGAATGVAEHAQMGAPLSQGSIEEAVEKALKGIAVESSGRDASFEKFLEKFSPMLRSEQFVMRAHEHLCHALAEMSGDSPPRESSFSKYVHYVKDNNLVSTSRERNVPPTLFMLNSHRNQIVHSREMPEAELKQRAISYLMGIAQVWGEIASEPVGDEN